MSCNTWSYLQGVSYLEVAILGQLLLVLVHLALRRDVPEGGAGVLAYL